ncbi:Os02g0756850 [Oryza sativa Japonica Group]|uniref:Os02g0756850 protein n=1 Tax=Oryza sativa subsp. japonica TaxID=39947 RepID=A0A0P0VPN4_ORYSJ|nr:Os02g0756850 [Oryza sativa Japonica Group]
MQNPSTDTSCAVRTSAIPPFLGLALAASAGSWDSLRLFPSEHWSSVSWPASLTCVVILPPPPPFLPCAAALDRYSWLMVFHHCDTDGVGAGEATVSKRRKSETTAFCAGVKRPYQTTDTGMSPRNTVPLWYVSCSLGGGLYSSMSLLAPAEGCAEHSSSTETSTIAAWLMWWTVQTLRSEAMIS